MISYPEQYFIVSGYHRYTVWHLAVLLSGWGALRREQAHQIIPFERFGVSGPNQKQEQGRIIPHSSDSKINLTNKQ